ncbi:MAG: recombination protein RecR, partial [Syntrophobacterales bacterium]|nr:recombination protein RecR [Syntrophobacterales bacterium]
MTGYAAPIQRLIQELGRLPGIGEKTATRLAMFILRRPDEEARRLAESILDVKEKIRFCSVCFNLAEGELCPVCSDPARDRERICVVEDPDSLTAIEESGSFRGTYHV